MLSREKLKIKVVGAGLSGLMTAYFMQKLAVLNNQVIQIEIYDKESETAENASTISFAWLNAAYPCADLNDKNKAAYDKFRLDSLHDWSELNNVFIRDGIRKVISSDQKYMRIDGENLNSIYVFFNQDQQEKFMETVDRLHVHHQDYSVSEVDNQQVPKHFPIFNHLSANTFMCNVEAEALINPDHLRSQLIAYLKKNNVTFYWNAFVDQERIQSEPNTQWILTAGNGMMPLVSNTRLQDLNIIKESKAEVIYCDLNQPVDLKGKMFHLATTANTPGFHLRNDDFDSSRMKIVIEHSGKSLDLEKTAQAIFNLLKLDVRKHRCINTIKRPITLVGRPLIEYGLGEHDNIHVCYGHNLYSVAAKLYPAFANNVAYSINHHLKEDVFYAPVFNHALDSFAASNRFKQKTRYSFADLQFLTFNALVNNKQQILHNPVNGSVEARSSKL